MRLSGVWLFVGAILCGSGVEGRMRTMTRKSSPTPTPTPTATPGCKVPAAKRAIAGTAPCASGVESFALQISDCNNPANGQFVKVRVAPILYPAGADPDTKEAHLWIDEACSLGDCGDEPLLTDAPTLFYLDSAKNIRVAPSSPLPANGTWLNNRRLIYSSNGDLPGAVIPLVQFEDVNNTNAYEYQVACSRGSDDGFTCTIDQHSGKYPFGTQPNTDDELSNGRGTAVAIAEDFVWFDNCRDPGCGPTTLKAIPACQPSKRGILDVLYS